MLIGAILPRKVLKNPIVNNQNQRPRTMNVALELDLKGHTCPIPLLRTKKALKNLSIGEKIRLLVTDPSTRNDLARFCLRGSCKLIDQSREPDHDVYILEKS